MVKDFSDITLALGGLFQACALVHELATTGECDEAAYKTTINSVLMIDAKDVPTVYGNNIKNLQLGLNHLAASFSNNRETSHADITRYALSLIHLERKLLHNEVMKKKVRNAIAQTQNKINYFGEFHPNVISSLAEIYVNNFGQMNFRIRINGKAQFLLNAQIVDKCRALFLCGIRSAVLWHQVGGTRWQVIFNRKKIVTTAKILLD